MIKSLDVANDRLQSTIASLRRTAVRPGLSSSHESANDSGTVSSLVPEETDKPTKTLHDFVDESTHLDLLESLRATIDSYNDAQADFLRTRETLDDSLREVDGHLTVVEEHGTTRENSGEAAVSVPDLFTSIATHVSEAASLLQSLISHYDLCITALKHTEGGGEAAREAANSPSVHTQLDSANPGNAAVEESLYVEKIREPISAEEREEMLSVLDNDAQEVDDVVLEIKERLAEMETQGAQISTCANSARKAHKALKLVLEGLRKAGDALPSIIDTAKGFRLRWAELKAQMATKTDEVVSLTTFYESFLASYASLVREVERRKMVESKITRIAERTRKEIDALHAEDADMRDQFVREVGEYLPRDIWPGLTEAPRRWEVRSVIASDLEHDSTRDHE